MLDVGVGVYFIWIHLEKKEKLIIAHIFKM